MAMSPITPITPLMPIASIEPALKIGNIGSMFGEKPAEIKREGISFADMLKGMINNINETDAQTKADAYNLAMGFSDMEDLHNIEINAIKADLALRTMTSVRNKVLEAYSEIMRITV